MLQSLVRSALRPLVLLSYCVVLMLLARLRREGLHWVRRLFISSKNSTLSHRVFLFHFFRPRNLYFDTEVAILTTIFIGVPLKSWSSLKRFSRKRK